MSALSLSDDDRKVSNYQLARMLVSAYQSNRAVIEELDSTLREHCRLDMTLPFAESHSTADLTQSLLRKLRKEKEIMWTASYLQRQETQ